VVFFLQRSHSLARRISTHLYYYRGRITSVLADPPACTVGERARLIWGTFIPLIMQNVRRYFLISRSFLSSSLTIDVVKALFFVDHQRPQFLWIGFGTLVLAINVVLLSGYTSGLYSLRHLAGGFLDSILNLPLVSAYACVNCFNRAT